MLVKTLKKNGRCNLLLFLRLIWYCLLYICMLCNVLNLFLGHYVKTFLWWTVKWPATVAVRTFTLNVLIYYYCLHYLNEKCFKFFSDFSMFLWWISVPFSSTATSLLIRNPKQKQYSVRISPSDLRVIYSSMIVSSHARWRAWFLDVSQRLIKNDRKRTFSLVFSLIIVSRVRRSPESFMVAGMKQL